MIVTNEIKLSVGDVYKKKGDESARFVVNRIEKTTLSSGVEQILSVRLKQTMNGNSINDVGVNELFDNYELIQRRPKYVSNIQENVNEKIDRKEAIQLANLLDATIHKLKVMSGAVVDESQFHLDIAHLVRVLGDIAVFRRHRWLASIIYFIDKMGRNFGAAMSTREYEKDNGYGFVMASSENIIKSIINGALMALLKRLNKEKNSILVKRSTESEKEWIEKYVESIFEKPMQDEQGEENEQVVLREADQPNKTGE